ncbi:MAG: head decoration protein [Treponema sp.]|jgi:hypothetical protein|nr:head decoration protein [Treponema sp.]
MTYPTDFFYRPIIQNNAPLAAGTYVRGQLLGRVTATGVYKAYTSGASDGTQVVRAVVVNDMNFEAGSMGAIAKGEFLKESIIAVNAGLSTPIIVNDVLIGTLFDAGIILN